MDLSPIWPSSLSILPSPYPIETSCYIHKNHTYLHLPLVLHTNSYHVYFYGHCPIPTSIVVAAAGKQLRMNKIRRKKQVSAGAIVYGNQNQYTQTNTHESQNVFLWKDMIRDSVKNGLCEEALRLYYQMQRTGIEPDKLVFVSVIHACRSLLALQAGREIHRDIITRGLESDAFLGTALTLMYAKCGDLESARQVFDRMHKRNVVSWNAIIAGYSQNGLPDEALAFFYEMQVQGIKPSSITVVSVLPACAGLMALEQGKQIHGYVIRSGFEYDVIVGTALVNMYAKCGSVNIAYRLFERMPERNVVSWNAIIAGYCQNGHSREALAFFNEMQLQGINPNSITMASVLPACGSTLALEQGKQIHGYVTRRGFESNVVVGTGLVDMYAKCGNVNIACNLFERMPQKNVVSWTAIIAGYSQTGCPHEALAFFNEMLVQGIKPNSITMASVLPACADTLALEQGKQIHSYVIRNGFESNVIVVTGIVDMYAKCGHIGMARQVFDKMSSRNVVSWNAMILGYGFRGHGEDALALFSQMQQTGTKADNITFIGVLTACSRAGLVDEGWRHFKSMKSDYGIVPELKHYACLVDLLGLYR